MKFDMHDKATWPPKVGDYLCWSSDFGFTIATFYDEGPTEGQIDESIIAGFGNWFDRMGDDEESGYRFLTGEVQWWPLPAIEKGATA